MNEPESPFIVVTTIQEPTACMQRLADKALETGMLWIVVGDRIGPFEYPLPPAELLNIEDQRALPYRLAAKLPEKHYARKNLGYLEAMSRGCTRIFETDDDNAPMENWRIREAELNARRIRPKGKESWANVYSAFSPEKIWPRGLPLEQVNRPFGEHFELEAKPTRVRAPIQQGLANGSPDVDAVWRLVLDKDITFREGDNLLLPPGVWCPFNSQNTWWWPEAFPLLYLPSHCSFRMTDIWRSFVAQRCLWELGYELEFHQADMFQERNEHRLIRDFEQECVGYLRNEEIRQILEKLPLQEGAEQLLTNIADCYRALAAAEVVGPEEVPLVDAWIEDCALVTERYPLARSERSAASGSR